MPAASINRDPHHPVNHILNRVKGHIAQKFTLF